LSALSEGDLALRREVVLAFARTGRPPERVDDHEGLRRLADAHVVVLDDRGAVVMAHPFAAPPGGCEVRAGDRVWWGNCAWDGLGIVAALGLRDAVVTSGGVAAAPGALFHVAVPARAWWDDIGFT
jgi:hypothetical protein